MARPKRDPSATSTRERVLQAAELAFGAAGYESVRLEDIAHEAGITRPSLLYHFGSKELLYSALIERSFASLRSALAGEDGLDGGFQTQFHELWRRYEQFLHDKPHFGGLLLREILDDRGPGRQLLRTHLVPLLDDAERFFSKGKSLYPAGFPLRAAILDVGSAALLRAAAGPLRASLWGDGEHSLALLRAFLPEIDGDPGQRSSSSSANSSG